MPYSFWMFLLTFAIVLFPHPFILRKYEQTSFSGENFQAFQFFETVWLILNIGGFAYGIKITNDYLHTFTLMTMFLSSITLPTALFSGFTGIYPERSRIGYNYYANYKTPPMKLLLSKRKYSELKIVGWIQFVLLVCIIVVAAVLGLSQMLLP